MKKIVALLMLLITSQAFAKKTELEFGGRRFVVVGPSQKPTSKRPLLLLLHGCKQSPEIILEGTRLAELAVRNNFYILAPEQTVFENIDHCWNWFFSWEQTRKSTNQMGQMIAGIQRMIEIAEVDPNRIYLAGISAGGVMGHNLASCYPDVFQGAALTAGLSYKIAEDPYEASTVLDAHHFKKPDYLGREAYKCGSRGGPRKLSKMLLVHGENDKRVDPFHSQLISAVNAITLDHYDDGRRNNSATFTQAESKIPFRNGYAITQRDRRYRTVNFTERLILVKGMAHAWGGGKPISENFDPKAPSMNEFILGFFGL